MDAAVRAEVGAVADLRAGVERFSHHLESAIRDARSQLRTSQEQVRRAVEQRRQRLDRASRDLAAAGAALRRCPPEARRAAMSDLARARAVHDRAQASFDRARQASAAVDRAGNELLRSLTAAKEQADSHSAAARTYLTTLDKQLQTIVSGGHSRVSAVAGTLGMIGKAVAAQLAVPVAVEFVERAAHLPGGMLHEVDGLVSDAVDVVKNAPPLGEADVVLERPAETKHRSE